MQLKRRASRPGLAGCGGFLFWRWNVVKVLSRTSDKWRTAGIEPRLDEVFADPIVHLVMERDCVSHAELRAVVAQAQGRLRNRLCHRAAA